MNLAELGETSERLPDRIRNISNEIGKRGIYELSKDVHNIADQTESSLNRLVSIVERALFAGVFNDDWTKEVASEASAIVRAFREGGEIPLIAFRGTTCPELEAYAGKATHWDVSWQTPGTACRKQRSS